MAQRLDKIDRWIKILSVAALIFGLVIAAILLFQGWKQNQTLGAANLREFALR